MSVFRSLFRRAQQSPHHQNDRARRRSRLGLECLESREVPAFFTVTTPSDIPVAGQLTLREAITQANGSGAGVHFINFALPAGQSVITIGSQLPTITNDQYILGTVTAPVADDGPPVDNRVTIKRNAAIGDFRLFRVGQYGSAVFASLILRDGYAPGVAGFGGEDGGAILAQGKSLVVTNCEIRDNNAGGSGGGIVVEAFGYGTGGTLEVYDSLITTNGTAGLGGGIYFTGSSMIMSNSRVHGNNASSGGGGMWLGRFTSDQVTVTLNHVEISNNGTGGDGAGIYCGAIQTFIVKGDSNIHHNAASGKGGGIYLSPAFDATLQDVTLADNQAATGRGMYVGRGTNKNWTEGPGPGQLHLGGTPVDDIVYQQ